MPNTKSSQKETFTGEKSRLTFVLTIVTLSVALFVGAGVYTWQHYMETQTDEANENQVQSLQKQIEVLKNQQKNGMNETPPTDTEETEEEGTAPTTSDQTAIENEAKELAKAFASGDMQTIANDTHPDKGVRFSPYTSINTSTDLVFKPTDVEKLLTNQTQKTWGTFDGSGAPIKLSYSDYAKKFITDKDFVGKGTASFDTTLTSGNTIDNTKTVYPAGHFVEYYIAPTTKDELDWSALKLVFEQKDSKWYLVGVIHNQWTI